MFKSISKLINTWPKTVLISTVTLILIAGSIGSGVISKLTTGGFDTKSSDSYQASERINKEFNRTSTNIILEVTFKQGNVDDIANVDQAKQLEQKLSQTENVSQVFSYWSTGGASSLRGNDGKQALILGSLAGTETQIDERIGAISGDFTINNSTYSVGVGGGAEIGRQFNKQISTDMGLAETIALPLTFIILLIVFRSFIAASIPLIFGVFSIMGSMFILYILTMFTEVSIYALNLTTMLSLGLAIDYSLFMVARFRENLALGDSVETAIEHTIAKAGRTVLFSALTVAVSLAALMVFPQSFLRSFAFAGVAVASVSALGSLLLVPAILRLLGKNINKWTIGKPKDFKRGSKFWHLVAEKVTKRPAVVAVSIVAILLLLGTPFLSINLGQNDERSLPKDNPARVVHDSMRANFSSRETSGLDVVSKSNSNVNLETIDQYSITLSNVKNVDHVESATGIYKSGLKVSPAISNDKFNDQKGTWLTVIPSIEPFSSDGENLTKAIRSTSAPFEVLVGGFSADLTDLKQAIFDKLPLAFTLIAIATFILMFMMFGSILIPIEALIINVISLSAVFGIVTWIFQDGNLSELLVFTATGSIDASMPILMFCIAFGLSMDYSVFLLSRIKEHYDKTGNTRESVINGLEKTGGIVSAAAISISIVFLAFSTSGVTTIKLLGFGLSVAILLDAFVIRGTLVPAFLKLTGKANWWAPKFLRKLYKRFGISE